jgi:hypothetical protein
MKALIDSLETICSERGESHAVFIKLRLELSAVRDLLKDIDAT